jgi:hypothetical protein
MNNNELILGLIDKLNPSCNLTTVSPWLDDLITQAGNTIFNATTPLSKPTCDELKNYIKARKSCKLFDKSKAKYFCFIPFQEGVWNVYILDLAKSILSQTDDYSGEIEKQGNAKVKESFLLEL